MLVGKNRGLQGAFTLAQATSPVKVPADGAMDGKKHWEAWVRPHINKEKGQVTGSYWYATPMVAVDCLAEVRKDFSLLVWLVWFICLFVRFVALCFVCLLRKPAGRLGVVSPCERSENRGGGWGRGGANIEAQKLSTCW